MFEPRGEFKLLIFRPRITVLPYTAWASTRRAGQTVSMTVNKMKKIRKRKFGNPQNTVNLLLY
ncbi:MAG: hypothetical protein AMJ79_06375 [Phycisphaerae bacterium SM23_30]|nr:MAG: hypothetical protein AMJ79_06375 [Phycisphaerae bacterium SM23_30]